MKKINLTELENLNGGIRCAFDFSNTDPVCMGLFTAFAAAAAGFNNFTGAAHICETAGTVGCTIVFP